MRLVICFARQFQVHCLIQAVHKFYRPSLHKVKANFAMLCAWQDIKFAVHAHPTLSEVIDELFKSATLSEEKIKCGSK